MGKTFIYFTSLILVISLISCTTYPLLAPPPSANSSGPRTIILDGEVISEEKVGGLISWYCQDFTYGGRVLVEVGFFGGRKLEGLGFILYDGGYSGEYTNYQRTGIEHRWDWGPNGNDYAFVIKPDGTGLYYDFSIVSNGKSVKARDVYQCHKR